MNLSKTSKPSAESEKVLKSQSKAAPIKYQGNRFGSLILLMITVLISLAFYVSGQ